MTTTKLIVDTAFDLHKANLLSRKELIDILQDLVNATALDNGYAKEHGLPFPDRRRSHRRSHRHAP